MTQPEPTTPRPPLLMLHGLFGRPELLADWVRYFTAAGFDCHTPTLPGRDPVDRDTLRTATLDDYFQRVLDAYDELDTDDTPPVVIGHSIGGLLGQKLAAARPCAALVLLASVPPGVLWAQPTASPHLLPLLPGILAGRPILPSARTFREIPLTGLPEAEQEALIPRLVPDSGRVFRAMTFGTRATRVPRDAVRCPVLCVSGGADRNVADWISRRLARRYAAEHQAYPDLPHWIIAPSAVDRVAPPVLKWLTATLADQELRSRRAGA
jgi:pimeloyl-ACP methyl ester carboxylesterase